MTLQVSTRLRNTMLDGGSLKSALAAGFIKIYSGAAPTSADAAVTGTLLSVISESASPTGVDLGVAADGSIPKDPAQVWSGVNLASGTAGYFRYVGALDTGAGNLTEPRLQGRCATAGADLNMSSVNLTAGATQTIDACNILLPTS